MKKHRFVDLFCGGGGSISGAIDALDIAGEKYEGRGFNHWELAIKTIQANHPEVVPDFDRACAPIESILPNEIFSTNPEHIDTLWASPSCTHHSVAAGGRPRSNQLRSQPEYLLPYLRLTKCRRMFVENVRELQSWGPILDRDTTYKGKKYKAGQADPRKKGLFFNLWLKEIKASGYQVETAMLNAADYGAATSRKRLIIQAVRKSSGCKIVWPEPTHMQNPGLLAGTYKPWRSAAEIIDWSIPGKSIFNRPKPLKPNTIKRIEAGIRKYWGAWAEPFLIILRGTKDNQIPSSAIPLSAPLPAITAQGGHIALIRPFLTRYNGGDDRNHAINEPMPVIDCGNRYAVVSPVLIDMSHPGDHADMCRIKNSGDSPIGTITTRNNWAVAFPLFIPQHSAGTVKPVSNPVSTIATTGSIGIVEPFFVEYYGNGSHSSITNPLHTVTTKDRFGVIQGRILSLPNGSRYKLDITHRMLTMRELADATGFAHDYIFCGGDTAAKKQIGNAVPPDLARALYLADLAA